MLLPCTVVCCAARKHGCSSGARRSPLGADDGQQVAGGEGPVALRGHERVAGAVADCALGVEQGGALAAGRVRRVPALRHSSREPQKPEIARPPGIVKACGCDVIVKQQPRPTNLVDPGQKAPIVIGLALRVALAFQVKFGQVSGFLQNAIKSGIDGKTYLPACLLSGILGTHH